MVSEIKKVDKSDSESDYEARLGIHHSDDELQGEELDQLQGCILDVLQKFRHQFTK